MKTTFFRNLFFTALVLVIFLPTSSIALVIEADDPVFGVDALTRDTDQGLDFLDVTFSTNRSYNDVSGQFGIGGDYEGFRYATEEEVIALINNWGFSPGAVARGGAQNGDTAGDQLSGLVSLLGVNMVGPTSFVVWGVTSGVGPPHYGTATRWSIMIWDYWIGDDGVNAGPLIDVDAPAVTTGSFLVTTAPQPVIPEPSTLSLFGIGALGFIGYGWRRWKKNRKEK